ncbi:MAG: 2OG-Fe(II) oxygenase family protein, partial [Pseudohongiellaceae bacterium]
QIGEQWLLRKNLEKAEEFLNLSLASAGMNNRALALQSVLLNHQGNEAGLLDLYRYEQLLLPNQVQVSEAFGTTAEFNRQLVECLDKHVTMEQDPQGQATVNGLHSRSISHIQDPAMVEMNRLIGVAFKHAAEQAALVQNHLYPGWLPQRQILDSWTVRLRAGGFQRPHIHPRAWLSGCYYVKIPAEVHSGEANKAGWIEFGSPDEKYAVSNPLALRSHEPNEGDLVTFPSYYWHNTVPFSSDEERISLAFDICPA